MSGEAVLPEPAWDGQGLVPAIVQDAATGQVLMLAYMNREALDATVETGDVHFWSRSRRELWRKGATSGNTMRLVSLAADCDADALVVLVEPAGPACHTGAVSCFDQEGTRPAGFAALDRLWATVRSRIEDRPEGSYTASLVERGPEAVGRKLVEESVEVLLAARDHAAGAADDRRVAEEAADLVYHLLVALGERQVDPSLVMEVLAERRAAR